MNVTVVLNLLEVLFVTIEITPTVVPGAVVSGDTLIVRPKSEDCADAGIGTNTIVKQIAVTTLLIK